MEQDRQVMFKKEYVQQKSGAVSSPKEETWGAAVACQHSSRIDTEGFAFRCRWGEFAPQRQTFMNKCYA